MLSDSRLNRILERIPDLAIGVVGDLFLDRYLDIEASLTEPSIETGLDAYQVVRVRPSPGAAGTVINNLVSLGVGKVHVVSVIGSDGEGYELDRALGDLKVVDREMVFFAEDREYHTPTYTKPMLCEAGQPPRELNRLDMKNRKPLAEALEQKVLQALDELWPKINALIVVDQVSEADCGVVTARVRDKLAELGHADPKKVILADSRERIGLFQAVWLKPNEAECIRAIHGDAEGEPPSMEFCATELMGRAGRPIFCTGGERGILITDPKAKYPWPTRVPAFPVDGPIDVVGAGDSVSAALACALAAGVRLKDAAVFGNLVASITIQQIGTTGTATPEQVRERWNQVRPEPTEESQKPEDEHAEDAPEAASQPPAKAKPADSLSSYGEALKESDLEPPGGSEPAP